MEQHTPVPPTISFPLPIPRLTFRERLRRNLWWIAPTAILALCVVFGGAGFALGRSTASPSGTGADQRSAVTKEDHERALAAAVQQAEEAAVFRLLESLAQRFAVLNIEDGMAMTIRNNRWAAATGKEFLPLAENSYPVLCYARGGKDARLGMGLAGDPRAFCFVFTWSGERVPREPTSLTFGKYREIIVGGQ